MTSGAARISSNRSKGMRNMEYLLPMEQIVWKSRITTPSQVTMGAESLLILMFLPQSLDNEISIESYSWN